jgi:hypothetical protein
VLGVICPIFIYVSKHNLTRPCIKDLQPSAPPLPTTLCPLVQPVDKCILCTGSTGQVNILHISLWTCIYSVYNPLDMYLLCIYLEHDHLNRYILCSLYRILWSGIYYLQDPLIQYVLCTRPSL